ncbi:MAG: response regulator transcription factor [Marmoricola sp.]
MLVVEDSDEIGAPLVRTLEREGYAVTWVETGEAGLDHLDDHEIDLMILDLGLPDIDGLEVCRSSRARGYAGGIMICTARGEELDRVVGLDYGADDYLPKPFGLAELHARVRALLRRTAPRVESSTPPPDPGVTVDRSARRVTFAGNEIALTNKEYDVLAMLTESPGSVVSRETMMSEVWDEHWFGSTKTLDVTVGRLRQKLELAGVPDSVITVRGVGFRLDRGKVDA